MTSRKVNLLIVASTLSSILIIVLVLSHLVSLEGTVQELTNRQMALVIQNERAETRIQELRTHVATLEDDIAQLLKPQAVDGPAQFPVSRVLARKNDTVAAMAQRENTSSDIIYALNSWLNGRDDLLVGQAIWIPNRPN